MITDRRKLPPAALRALPRGRLVALVGTLLLASALSPGCASKRPEIERFNNSARVSPTDFPDVPAVVLLDRTELTFSFSVEKSRPYAEELHTRRTQILNQRGLEQARFRIPYDNRTEIFHIQARRISPNGDVEEMPADRFVKVPRFKPGTNAAKLYGGDGYKQSKVSNVQVGDVIEVSYVRVFRDPRWVEPIRVSGPLPVVRGEVVVQHPRQYDVDFRVTKGGRVENVRPVKLPTTIKGLEASGEGVPGTRHAFVFERERALYPEDLRPSDDAMSTQVHVQLKGYELQGKRYSAYANWDDVGAWYRELTAPSLKAGDDLSSTLVEIGGATGSKRDKLQRVQRYLQDRIIDVPTFQNLAALPAQKPSTVIAAGLGDAKDQASLGLALLRAMGVDGFPVLVSRLGSVAAVPDLPTPAPFNHVIIAIPMGGRYSFIDPSTPFLPTGRLPGALQGQPGLLIRPAGTELLDLPVDPPRANRIDMRYDLAVAKNGLGSGQIRIQLDGIDAARARLILSEGGPDMVERMRQLLVPGEEQKLRWADVVAVGGKRNKSPDSTLKMQVVVSESQVAGEMGSGKLDFRLEEIVGRPLPVLWRESRLFPIVFDHRFTSTISVSLSLPDGLGVDELPVEELTDTDHLRVRDRYAVADGELWLKREIEVKTREAGPELYPELRSGISRVWGIQTTPIYVVPGGERGKTYGSDPF